MTIVALDLAHRFFRSKFTPRVASGATSASRFPRRILQVHSAGLRPIGFDQNVIMVRQNTPGVNDARVIPTSFQQVVLAFGHPLVVGADDVGVLVTGPGDEELLFAFKTPMRRRMPGTTLLSPIRYGLVLLFVRESAVVVHPMRLRS